MDFAVLASFALKNKLIALRTSRHQPPGRHHMIRYRTLLPLLFVLCAATLSGCASSRSALPSEWDGLVLQPGTRLGAVFVKPDAEISSYTSVMLDPVQVSFARNWDPNRGGR